MRNLFLLSALVANLGLLTAPTNCLHAATFTVTTTNISGPGSLPVAIAQANATPGDNQILFTVTNAITLGLALPMITNSVAINGNATVHTVISGGGTLPLFFFAAGTTNSLSNLVLANGYSTNNGAAISNSSTLSVTSCLITNNSATNRSGGAIFNSGVMVISSSVISANYAGSGGAVYNLGTMTLNNSMMSGNQVISAGVTFGGAIFNSGSLAISILTMSNNLVTGFSDGFGGGIFNAGALSISQATFVSNTVTCPLLGPAYGGALHSDSGTVKITNSTFFGNAAIGGISSESDGNFVSGYGGSVSVQSGNCTLINCTVANNSAMGGAKVNISNKGQGIAGGIYNASGTVSLLNTIIAGNSASDSSPDLNGIFVSSGVNLIGNNQGATGLSIFDFQNVAANLGTLQNNGGSTLTCVPQQSSLAIGNGASTGAPTTDQRGVPRPQNGTFDIGAVQVVTGSPFVTGAAMISGSGFNLSTIFDATNSYRIQASTNLTTWVNLITNGSGGALNYTDTGATNLNRRFYRTATP